MIKPNNKIKEIVLIVLLVFVFSYLLNFVWESFHAVFLYEAHDFNSMKYVLMISYVSAVDGFLILGMYLAVSVLWKDFLWIKQMNKKQNYIFMIFGLIIAAIIEYRAVFLQQRWNYNSFMPTIFGIGLSPLLQLSITGILAVWIAKSILYKKISN